MPPDKKDVRNRGPPSKRASELSIEERLSEKPTLDMDLMQFLVIAGFTYDWEPLYTDQGRQLLPEVIQKYKARRSTLPLKIKNLETMSTRRLRLHYDRSEKFGSPPIKTIHDMKYYVGQSGGRIRTVNLGPITFAYLNSALHYFDVPEIDFLVPKRLALAVQSVPRYTNAP